MRQAVIAFETEADTSYCSPLTTYYSLTYGPPLPTFNLRQAVIAFETAADTSYCSPLTTYYSLTYGPPLPTFNLRQAFIAFETEADRNNFVRLFKPPKKKSGWLAGGLKVSTKCQVSS